jgi:hypothetical protein
LDTKGSLSILVVHRTPITTGKWDSGSILAGGLADGCQVHKEKRREMKVDWAAHGIVFYYFLIIKHREA